MRKIILALVFLLWIGTTAFAGQVVPIHEPSGGGGGGGYPTVEDTLTQGFPNATTSHYVNMPATVNSGDLLVIWFACHRNRVLGTPSGWTVLQDAEDGSGLMRAALYVRDANGTEGGTTVDVSTGAGEASAAIVYRISGWAGSLSTDVDSATPNTEVSDTTSVNPPSVTAGWGSADNLFIALGAAGDDDASFTGAPTNYTNLQSIVSGAGTDAGAEVGSAIREYTSSSDDPDAFTLSVSERYVATTLVVEPN
jgi:hypothetical protein